MIHEKRSIPRLRGAPGVFIALALVAGYAAAQPPPPGDVNGDGEVNILDVQATINMALGVAEAVPEADALANGVVDVRDVQALINTTLGIGGLVQPVVGILDHAGEEGLQISAMSENGRLISAPVDPETGEFRLTLPVRTAWSFAVTDAHDHLVGTLAFQAHTYVSNTLPLLQLGTGAVLDLGVLPPEFNAAPAGDLRNLLGAVGEPLDLGDYSGSGLPDILDELIFPLPTSIPFTPFSLPPELLENDLAAILNDCLAAGFGAYPSLVGVEHGGVPDFLLPVLDCLEASLRAWITGAGLDISSHLTNLYVDYAMSVVEDAVPAWLGTLGRPELLDTTGSFLPDFVEPYLCVPGVIGDCPLDQSGSGIPDFIEDDNGNGIPNFLDPETGVPGQPGA